MFCSISWLHLNEFSPNFHNRACFFMTIKKRVNNPKLTSKLYVLFYFLTPSKHICSKLSEQDSFCEDQKMGNNPILTSKLYILFCFLTPSKWICSKLSEQDLIFQDNWKNTLMSLAVCVRYVLNDIFVQIKILRCAYMLTFFIMHMLHGYGTCIRMCMHMCTCLGTKILSQIHIKRTCVYTWMCLSVCIFIY